MKLCLLVSVCLFIGITNIGSISRDGEVAENYSGTEGLHVIELEAPWCCMEGGGKKEGPSLLGSAYEGGSGPYMGRSHETM